MATKATTEYVTSSALRQGIVVVVLGHVDHGKTSLLDYIRTTKIADSESGGITQHIGTYQIQRDTGNITFIDTPGHEVFSAMRVQGVQLADLAILVVAADDGIKTQTKEAIQYIKESKIPFIVAFNKIDRPEADIERIKAQFLEESVLLEGYGGDVPYVPVSAKTGQGVDDLLNMVDLLADVSGAKEKTVDEVSAIVVESFHDAQKGVGATLIMRGGNVGVGDVLAGKSALVKLKAIEDYQGKRLSEVTPGMPFVVYGFSTIPRPGDVMRVADSVKEAENALKQADATIVRAMSSIPKGEDVVVLIVKADTGGTMAAVSDAMQSMRDKEQPIHVLYSGVGDITDSDLRMALDNNAFVIGFCVKQSASAKTFIRNHKAVNVFSFNTIYDLTEGVEKIINEQINLQTERVVGKMKILKIFRTEKNRIICGGRVLKGVIEKGDARVSSGNEANVRTCSIIRLKQEQNDITSAKEGMEVGLQLSGGINVAEGDILEYITVD